MAKFLGSLDSMGHGFKSHHLQMNIDHCFFFLSPTTPTSSPSVSWGGSFLLNNSGPDGTLGAHTMYHLL